MRLIFLGTGAGVPSKFRNVSSIVLDFNDTNGDAWLIDAGEGAQLQLMKTTISLRKIRRIFVSHLHGDHLFGLPGLLGSRSFQENTSPLDIYGPRGIEEYVETTLRLSASHLTYDVSIHEIDDGQELFHDQGYRMTTRLLDHVVPSFGYRIEEDERPGELQVDKLRELGLGPGPNYGRLKAGESVTLDDGRIVNGKDYLGPGRPGRILAICSDTRPCAAAVDLARGADVFVHESTYARTETALAPGYGHSTCVDAARLAAESGCHTLVLTHFSARYSPDDMGILVAQAREIFPETFVMTDLAEVGIPLR